MRHNLAIRQPFRHSRSLSSLLAACLLSCLIIWGFALNARLAGAALALAAENARVALLQAELHEAEQVAAPRRRAIAILAALDRDAVDPAVIRRMESAAPPDVWLVSASVSRGHLLTSGRAVEWRSVAAFTEGLSHVLGLSHVELGSLQARGTAGGYEFSIHADVSPPTSHVPR